LATKTNDFGEITQNDGQAYAVQGH